MVDLWGGIIVALASVVTSPADEASLQHERDIICASITGRAMISPRS
jgi:hypothetical protein